MASSNYLGIVTGGELGRWDVAPDTIEIAGANRFALGSVGIHREFITAATKWIMEPKL
jgi:hypothetical protein